MNFATLFKIALALLVAFFAVEKLRVHYADQRLQTHGMAAVTPPLADSPVQAATEAAFASAGATPRFALMAEYTAARCGLVAEGLGAEALRVDDLGRVETARPVLLPTERESHAHGHREERGEHQSASEEIHSRPC